MRVIYSDPAYEDLHGVFIFIAQDNIDRAASFTLELEEQIDKLVDYPFKHPPYSIKEYGDTVRVFHYHGYRVIYEVKEKQLNVHEISKDEKQPRALELL